MAISTAAAGTTILPRHRYDASSPPAPAFLLSKSLLPTFSSYHSSPAKSLSFRRSHHHHFSLPQATASSSTDASEKEPATLFHGPCYVVGDNVDTDQIIPAEHLTLVPSKPDEYHKLGSLALIGLPSPYPRFVSPGKSTTDYPIVIGGANFGCGSSREHAPVALGASGVKAVVAESYARIFFRNCVATGEIYPVESESRLREQCRTGDVVTVDLEENLLVNLTTGEEYRLKPIGDAGPVIQAGGIFAYARKTGMISAV